MGYHGYGDVFVFASRASASVERAKVAAELDRAPARFNERPAQPLVALPQ